MFIKGFSKFTMRKTGTSMGWFYFAIFDLHEKINILFPYLNSIMENVKYYEKPEYIDFAYKEMRCVLYPESIVAAPFKGRDEAIDFINEFIVFLNDIWAKRDSIKPDYNKIAYVSILEIFKLLPGNNCKKCGYPTCLAFSAALSKGKVMPDTCPALEKPVSERALYPVVNEKGELLSTVSISVDYKKLLLERNWLKSYAERLEEKFSRLSEKQKDGEGPAGAGKDSFNLTKREIDVLHHISLGLSNIEIARLLSISPHTVKSHVNSIFSKLGASDRTDAAVIATRYKLI